MRFTHFGSLLFLPLSPFSCYWVRFHSAEATGLQVSGLLRRVPRFFAALKLSYRSIWYSRLFWQPVAPNDPAPSPLLPLQMTLALPHLVSRSALNAIICGAWIFPRALVLLLFILNYNEITWANILASFYSYQGCWSLIWVLRLVGDYLQLGICQASVRHPNHHSKPQRQQWCLKTAFILL